MAVIFFALFLRTYDLDNRPLHVDEAVHAVKFGELLEDGFYKYDPIEYHGPTLNYFTLITAKISGIDSFSNLNEYTIRLVPALISVLFILFFVLVLKEPNKSFVFLSTFLITISSIFVFYGRYYIQEALLVSFSYLFVLLLFQYLKNGRTSNLIISGICAGLVFATKETSIIIFGTFIASVIFLYFSSKEFKKKLSISASQIFIFFICAILISVLFYSSFFTNWEGILDSVRTYANYFRKAATNSDHVHPWYYYIKLLLYSENSMITFSEIFLILFSVIGIFFSFSNKGNTFLKFLSIYSFLQLSIYSVLPYKTPWLALNFWIGFLVLAAFGIVRSYQLIKPKQFKLIFTVFITLGLLHNLWQTYTINFKYPYQPENPFTYSQAEFDVLTIAERISQVAKSTKENENILIDVISPNDDYWPLPWYLRKFNNVGWRSMVDTTVYHFPIIISVPEYEDKIVSNLYSVPPPGKKNLYVPLFDDYRELRPGVELRGYVEKEVLDIYNRTVEQ